MIDTIEYKGPLVTDTSIPGEMKVDDIIPAQGNVIQLSKDRWAVFFATKVLRLSFRLRCAKGRLAQR
jgi:hypothetical protein